MWLMKQLNENARANICNKVIKKQSNQIPPKNMESDALTALFISK